MRYTATSTTTTARGRLRSCLGSSGYAAAHTCRGNLTLAVRKTPKTPRRVAGASTRSARGARSGGGRCGDRYKGSVAVYNNFYPIQLTSHQEDTEERNPQVPLMKEVYQRASSVVVWLGGPIEVDGKEDLGPTPPLLEPAQKNFKRTQIHHTTDGNLNDKQLKCYHQKFDLAAVPPSANAR
ncbi:uncharacterized protein L3040_002209 [Drepanopeziza brunnea f. sp. 'multigermtubi']|uniref:uncharacterized protein n=1 Tax=Drepanopeziza brunnea f. sp. 'multigermtubi' TaxID=698441 RepID=UPI0023922CCC|nr:hypothetical protein L3040_002209 [Drepanopeziza brunnea f. sp. 'multigermtubi']